MTVLNAGEAKSGMTDATGINFTAETAPRYEDDLALLPAHRRLKTLLDRAVELRIGDCVFAVPPELIQLRAESRADKTHAVRQAEPMMSQAGYAEREVRVTLYFTSIEEINGFPVPGPEGAVYYMDGLRSFLAMVRHCPLLPVRNEYLNLVCDVWAVMVAGVVIQTVDGFPGVLSAEIVMRPASMEAYLMRHASEFDEMVNWPLFRWHYQRPIASGMSWAPAARPLPLIADSHWDDRLGVAIVDASRLGNDPWDKVFYLDYPLPDGVFVRSLSLQLQNVLAPLQTQLAEEPVYQFMGSVETTVLLQLECEDRTGAAALVQLHQSALAHARSFHNRIVTSPIRLQHQLLNVLGIEHVMIEALDVSTVPGMPGLSQVTMALTAYNQAQSQEEKLKSFTPAGNYANAMDALQSIKGQDLTFIEQAELAELYFQGEQLYPDLDLPTFGVVKQALSNINRQRAQLALTPIPFADLSPLEWSDSSVVDPDFWMTYPGLGPGGVFDLDTLHLPQDVQAVLRGESLGANLNANQAQIHKTDALRADNLPDIAGIDLLAIPTMTYEQIGIFLRKHMQEIPIHRSLWKSYPSTVDHFQKTDQVPVHIIGDLEDTPDYLLLTAKAFEIAQTDSGISAAFWIALGAYESNWGQCDTKEGGRPTPTWTARNSYSLTTVFTDPSHVVSTDGSKAWKKYGDALEGLQLGAKQIQEEFYVRQRRTTIAQMVVTYVGDNDGDDKVKWVTEISAVVEEAIGTEFAAKNRPEARQARAKLALKEAARLHWREYKSFDILDDESHRKPRAINDESERLAASLQNMVRYGHRGRLSRAFPSYMLVLIDEGGMDRYARKVWANFYMYHSLIALDLIRERGNPADLLRLSLTNVYGTLNWKTRHTIPLADGGITPQGIQNFLERAWDGLFFNWENNEYLLEYRKRMLTHFDMRPGMRVHLRMGFSANPAMMPTVFNGNITEIEFSDTIQAVAQGDGKELLNLIHDVKPSSPNSIDYTVSGMLINTLIADSSSWLGHLLASTTGGDLVGSREASATSRYGLEHFGPMKLENVFFNRKNPMYERYKNIYPADYDSRMPKPDADTIATFFDKLVALMDKAQGWLGFDQQNDNEKLTWIDARGKTVWDLIKICETISPGYVGYPIYHGFDTRLFFGMPMWNTVYGWGSKRERSLNELIGSEPVETKREVFQNPLGGPIHVVEGSETGTDNPNPRLNEDMFVEFYRPFVQFHYANSMTDILGNGIRTTGDYPTVAIGVYGLGGTGNYETPPQFADHTMRPDMQRTELVDLQMYQDIIGWNYLWNALGVTDTREIAIAATRNHLAKRMGEMYTGDLLLLGDPAINPHDYLHIVDGYWNMAGNVIVDRVVHHLSADAGFITTIGPKLVVLAKDQIGRDHLLASNLRDFSTDIGDTVKATVALSTGLIAMGRMRALMEGGSALIRMAQTVGDVTIPSARLGAMGLWKLGRFTFQIGKHLLGVALGRGKLFSSVATVKEYGKMVSTSWEVMMKWATTVQEKYAEGGLKGLGGASAEAEAAAVAGSAEAGMAARLITGIRYSIPFAITTALVSLGTFWVEGIFEEYFRNQETIVILPLAYHDSFLVAGIEGWSKLIPGYPDPKYVHVRNKADAAGTLLRTINLPDDQKFRTPLHTGMLGVTDRFGIPRNNRLGFHTGIDLAANEGTPIFATAPGVVSKVSQNDDVYGNYVEIRHGYKNGGVIVTKYAHMTRTLTKEGDNVNTESMIGTVGQTGQADGNHLHLEFIVNGNFEDPAHYITRF